jgi:hypothetical protein
MKPGLYLLLAALLPAQISQAPAQAPQPTGTPAPLASLQDMQDAQAALDELLRTYERGDVQAVQNRLDPGMIGYQRFVDGMTRDVAGLKQIRIHMFESQVTAGPDVAMIQAAWEKRFFGVTDFTPGIFSGRSTFLMHRDRSGWKLAAVGGDNPFSSEAGNVALLSLQPASLALGRVVGDAPIQIEVVDPDLAGLAQITVEVANSDGDREGVVLTALSPGRFLRPTLPVARAASATPGNGVLEFVLRAVPAPVTVTVRHVDANPGSNRPPSTLTRSMLVQ